MYNLPFLMSIKTYLLLVAFFLFFGCSQKPSTSVPQLEPPKTYSPLPSQFVINYRLDKRVIRDTFNTAIAELFRENFDIPDYDVKLNLYKTKEANVEIEGKSILVNIPVGILVEKTAFFVKMEARGVLELTFITQFDLDSLWNFKAKTDLSYYKWIEKPTLKMAGVSIPIEPISNVIIGKTKPMIVESIDDAIMENFTINKSLHDIVQSFKDPIELSESGGYLSLSPTRIYMQPFKNSKLSTHGKIKLNLNTKFSSFQPPLSNMPVKVPPLEWQDNINDTSVMRLVTHINMMDINAIVRKNYEGKTFTSEGKSITLNSIFVNCDYEHFRFATDVSGSVNGTLLITALPQYDPAQNAFKAKIVSINLRTKNRIHKVASWIAEGYVRRELEKMMFYPLKDQLDEVQNMVNEQIDEVNKEYNLDITAKLHSIEAEHFYMKPGAIETTIRTSLLLNAYIKDLRMLGK